MKFPMPPLRYDRSAEIERNRHIEREMARSHRKGQDLDVGRDVRLILTSPGGKRFALQVSDTGTLSTLQL